MANFETVGARDLTRDENAAAFITFQRPVIEAWVARSGERDRNKSIITWNDGPGKDFRAYVETKDGAMNAKVFLGKSGDEILNEFLSNLSAQDSKIAA